MDTPDYLRPALAIALAEARHAAGLTQPQLADFSGLARSYVAAIEGGTTFCSLEQFVRAHPRLTSGRHRFPEPG